MTKAGRSNGLTDVGGILVGHYTDTKAVSGVTAVVCPPGAVAGVDVRGSAPGTRETDLMAPHNLIEKAQAVVLSGGSVFWPVGRRWCDPLAGRTRLWLSH